jgi:hypothetical protein
MNEVPGGLPRVLMTDSTGRSVLRVSATPQPAGPGSFIGLRLDRRLAGYYGAPGYYSQNARVNNVIRDIRNSNLNPPRLFPNPWSYDYMYGPIGNVGDWNAQARIFRSQEGKYSIT